MSNAADEVPECDRDLLQIVERLYDGVTRRDAWLETVTALMSNVGGTSATLFLDGRAGVVPIAFPGFSDVALRLFADHYNKVDPWTDVARKLRPRGEQLHCFLGHHFVPTEAFEASEVWWDYSRHHLGAFHLLGSSFNLADGTQALMGLHRPRDAPAFEDTDLRRVRLVLPHLRNALFLMHRLEAAEDLARTGLAALEHMASGIAIVDRARDVIFANAAMERLAAAGDIHLRPDTGGARPGSRAQLSVPGPADQSRFAALVDQTTQRGPGGAMRLDRADGHRGLALLVMPLPGRLSPRASSGCVIDSGRALVIVRDNAHPVPLRAFMLKALYNLTDAEAAVAHALFGGRSPEALAAERGVSLPTIRTQIRQILEKAGVRSLRELEALLIAP
jgi:DNA-binding CsgD family transcriptional regulator